MDEKNLISSETGENELSTEDTDTEKALINEAEKEEENLEDEDLEKEIQELEASARKSFKKGMTIMVVSLLITLICALTDTFMNARYHNNPIKPQLDFIIQVCSYAFYLGLFFIIRYYIARRKIPSDRG